VNSFNKRTAVRISAVSLLLAVVASPIAWFVARENAEQSTVSLAMEESQRLLGHFDALALSEPDAKEHAAKAAETITGGLFDIAEIYDGDGNKLAES
jgi:lipopolysaccharide export system protein LptC